MRTKPKPTEAAIEGRKGIAVVLSQIMGIETSEKAVDRLMERRRHPLPVRGYIGRRWAYRSELEAWWSEMDEYGRRIGRKREEITA